MRGKSFVLFIGLMLALLAFTARPAHAADVRTGERVVIAADEVIDDDLIVSAQFVEINGTVSGDVVATGTIVVINGAVEGSVIVAAQSVEVRGPVGGSVYAMSYSLHLGDQADIGRNVLFGGFSATTQPGSLVGRDFFMAGYQLRHDGTVGGDLNVSVGALQLNGTVGGDVTGEVSAAGSAAPPQMPLPNMPSTVMMLPSGLVIGPSARIDGEMLAQEISPAAPPTTGVLGLPLWLASAWARLSACCWWPSSSSPCGRAPCPPSAMPLPTGRCPASAGGCSSTSCSFRRASSSASFSSSG